MSPNHNDRFKSGDLFELVANPCPNLIKSSVFASTDSCIEDFIPQ